MNNVNHNCWQQAGHLNVPAWIYEKQIELQLAKYGNNSSKMSLTLDLAEKNGTKGTGAPLAATIYLKDELIAIGLDAPGFGGHEMSSAIITAGNLLGYRELIDSQAYEMFSLAPPCTVCLGHIFSAKLKKFAYAVTHEDLLSVVKLPNTPFPENNWTEILEQRNIEVVQMSEYREKGLDLLRSTIIDIYGSNEA